MIKATHGTTEHASCFQFRFCHFCHTTPSIVKALMRMGSNVNVGLPCCLKKSVSTWDQGRSRDRPFPVSSSNCTQGRKGNMDRTQGKSKPCTAKFEQCRGTFGTMHGVTTREWNRWEPCTKNITEENKAEKRRLMTWDWKRHWNDGWSHNT